MFFLKLKWWWQSIIVSVLSLIIYLPVIGNSFVNDDFIVLKKVCIDGRLNTDGFFRPLSDISILLNCQLGGLHPLGFYLTGILLHALSTLLFLQLCLRWNWTSNEQQQQNFALLAGALFFTYPFHNESVAWILGRGALMANTFGIAALLILVSPGKEILKIIGACVCYFVGLAAYESVIVLPAMIFIYLWINKAGVRNMARWIIALSFTLVLHIWLRRSISGSFAGDYGADFFSTNWGAYIIKAFKALGRVFLPPMDNSQLLIGLCFGVLVMAAWIIVYLYKKISGDRQAVRFFYTQVVCFLVAMLIPALSGVSTRTSESDRFLHFPSYFISILTAFAIVVLLRKSKWVGIVVVGILCLQLYLLEKNNLNWRSASTSVTDILDIAKRNTGEQSLYIINLPEEINGAFIFRVGFKEALMINSIDTAKVHVLHKLSRDEVLLSGTSVELSSPKDSPAILPFLRKKNDSTTVLHYWASGSLQKEPIPLNSKIIYWNNDKWIDIK